MAKVFAASFWVVMSIHAIVFIALGLFTDRGWRMLLLFLAILALTMLIKLSLAYYAHRHPEKPALRRFLRIK